MTGSLHHSPCSLVTWTLLPLPGSTSRGTRQTAWPVGAERFSTRVVYCRRSVFSIYWQDAIDGNGAGGQLLSGFRWHVPPCGSGGTGRRTSLRGWRPQGRGGSNPPFRTNLRSLAHEASSCSASFGWQAMKVVAPKRCKDVEPPAASRRRTSRSRPACIPLRSSYGSASQPSGEGCCPP